GGEERPGELSSAATARLPLKRGSRRTWHDSRVAFPSDCRPFHSEVVSVGKNDYRIFRCDWGWCVKRGDDAFRSRTLLDAFEEAYRGRLEQPLLRDVVGAIERALEAERARTGRTASAVITADGTQLVAQSASLEPAPDSA